MVMTEGKLYRARFVGANRRLLTTNPALPGPALAELFGAR